MAEHFSGVAGFYPIVNVTDPSSDRSVELVAVINSFNRRQLLERAVSSLAQVLRKEQFGFAIMVFDAGSTDGSREFLTAWSKENPGDNLRVLSPSNGHSSFSEGVNTACSVALGEFAKCRWLLLYESDNWLGGVQPIEKAIALLCQQPRLGAVGFTVRKHTGEPFGYGTRFPSALSLALGQNVSSLTNLYAPNDSVWQMTDGIRWRTCDVVFTSPLLVRRKTWEESGGLDAAAFPFSDTDLDWAWRCAKLGWTMGVIETTDVVHDNLEQLSAWSATRVVDFHRNRFRLLKRHIGKSVGLITPFLFLRHLVETIVLRVKSVRDPVAKEKLAARREMLRRVWTGYDG